MFSDFQRTLAIYEARKIDPITYSETWERLRGEIEAAYARGKLSDAEHDDLFNRWLGATRQARRLRQERRSRKR